MQSELHPQVVKEVVSGFVKKTNSWIKYREFVP